MTENRKNEILQTLLKELQAMPAGERITTAMLLHRCFPEGTPGEDRMTFKMDIHYALFKLAGQNGLQLDMSAHDGKAEGMPYDLDYAVFHNKQG